MELIEVADVLIDFLLATCTIESSQLLLATSERNPSRSPKHNTSGHLFDYKGHRVVASEHSNQGTKNNISVHSRHAIVLLRDWTLSLLSSQNILTALLAWVAFEQWRSTEQSLELTRKALELTRQQLSLTREANEAAKNSAQAAQYANQAAERSVRIGNQAYIGMLSMQSTEPIVPNKIATVLTTFKNAGQTPASNVNVYSTYYFSRSDNETKLTEELTGKSIPVGLVLPGEEFLIALKPRAISQQEMNDLDKGTLRVYIYGHIEYKDTFGRGHSSRFCGVYSPPKDNGFFRCAEYNDEH